MPFGVVSAVGVLDGVVIVEGKGYSVFGGEFGRPIVINRDFVASLCESDALFPNYFGRTC